MQFYTAKIERMFTKKQSLHERHLDAAHIDDRFLHGTKRKNLTKTSETIC